MHRIFTIAALALTAIAHPIDLQTLFVPQGGDIYGVTTQAAPNMAGGGNLQTIVQHAASTWERSILDDWTIEIKYGWSDSIGGSLAQYYGWFLPFGGRHLFGRILFNPSFSWYADETPEDNEGFGLYDERYANLGGGAMNIGRRYTQAVGAPAGKFDLLTTALHELGHSFSIGIGAMWDTETADGDIDVISPRRYAGSRIPVANGHLSVDTSVLYYGLSQGERRLLTDVDLAAAMQINEHQIYGDPVPEPAGLLVLSVGFLSMLRRRIIG